MFVTCVWVVLFSILIKFYRTQTLLHTPKTIFSLKFTIMLLTFLVIPMYLQNTSPLVWLREEICRSSDKWNWMMMEVMVGQQFGFCIESWIECRAIKWLRYFSHHLSLRCFSLIFVILPCVRLDIAKKSTCFKSTLYFCEHIFCVTWPLSCFISYGMHPLSADYLQNA